MVNSSSLGFMSMKVTLQSAEEKFSPAEATIEYLMMKCGEIFHILFINVIEEVMTFA